MSAGYASRLSSYPNKGVCGLPEQLDTDRTYQRKIRQLIQYVQQSKYTVILTGAGISTSAGIPDFRGPNGIWTIEQQQQQKSTTKKRKRNTVNSNKVNYLDTKDSSSPPTSLMNFTEAKPTLTHRIITKLVQGDEDDSNTAAAAIATKDRTTYHVQFVITQNVDGLHRRSGLSRNYHSILHGCTFTEVCRTCHTEYFRNYDIGTVGFQHTGRYCTQCCDLTNEQHNVGNDEFGKLYDTVLDWEDPLPEYDYERSIEHCTSADLVLCLGTSLRIQPVSELPLLAKQFIIINLQITPYDEQAELVIRQRTDTVMTDLYNGLTGREFMQSESDTQQQPVFDQTWKIPIPNDEDDE